MKALNKLSIKYSAIAFCSLMFLPAFSQQVENWDDVPVILNAVGHKISKDGTFSTGEAIDNQSAWGRDNTTGEIYLYTNCSIQYGNCISQNHVVVGSDKIYMKGAFLLPQTENNVKDIDVLAKYQESHLNGITWDGTRMVGILVPPKDSPLSYLDYVPFYCDVDPSTLVADEPVFLPVPEKDFFNLNPQFITANWISDDGSVILGQVIDNSGQYVYPIVYTQESDGSWNYSLPSEALFNPNKLEIPVFPEPEIKEPNPVNYIGNDEFKKLYEEYWNAYLNGTSNIDPYAMLDPATAGDDALMTPEEYAAYKQAQNEYDVYYKSVYQALEEGYYDSISKIIAQSYNFLQGSMVLNNDGSLVGQTKMTTRFSGTQPIEYRNPVIFNLKDKTNKLYGNDLCQLEVTQILPDGTLVTVTPIPSGKTPDLSPQQSFIGNINDNSFVTIEDYIKDSNPDYYDWYEKYLYGNVAIGQNEEGQIVYKEMVVSGMVAVSDDFTTLSGGLDGWSINEEDGEYYTYIFSNMTTPEAGIEDIIEEAGNGLITVYDLQGLKVLETRDASLLNNLQKGVYIINKKKFIVK